MAAKKMKTPTEKQVQILDQPYTFHRDKWERAQFAIIIKGSAWVLLHGHSVPRVRPADQVFTDERLAKEHGSHLKPGWVVNIDWTDTASLCEVKPAFLTHNIDGYRWFWKSQTRTPWRNHWLVDQLERHKESGRGDRYFRKKSAALRYMIALQRKRHASAMKDLRTEERALSKLKGQLERELAKEKAP